MSNSTQKAGSILVVDDNEDLLKAAKIFLKRHFGQVDLEKNPESIPNLLSNNRYDVILLDCAPTGESLRFISIPTTLEWYMKKLWKSWLKCQKYFSEIKGVR